MDDEIEEGMIQYGSETNDSRGGDSLKYKIHVSNLDKEVSE